MSRSKRLRSSTTNSTHLSTRIPTLGSLRPFPVEEWTAIENGSSADVAPFRLRNGSRGNEREKHGEKLRGIERGRELRGIERERDCERD